MAEARFSNANQDEEICDSCRYWRISCLLNGWLDVSFIALWMALLILGLIVDKILLFVIVFFLVMFVRGVALYASRGRFWVFSAPDGVGAIWDWPRELAMA